MRVENRTVWTGRSPSGGLPFFSALSPPSRDSFSEGELQGQGCRGRVTGLQPPPSRCVAGWTLNSPEAVARQQGGFPTPFGVSIVRDYPRTLVCHNFF